MIKHRIILFVVGLVVTLLGIYPLLSNFAFMQKLSSLPAAGTAVYQALIIIFGLLAVLYSFQGNAKKKEK